MKYSHKGRVSCRWCAWRRSIRCGQEHECEALPPQQIPVRGCWCIDCRYRNWNDCPLESGMKEKTDWCEQGLTYEKNRHASVQLDNTCAMFKPLDLLNLDDWDWHPVAVKKAAAKAKDCKSNAPHQARAIASRPECGCSASSIGGKDNG